jgi:hypothetical protein
MFKEFYRRIYKSKKTISKESAAKLMEEKDTLLINIQKREQQIDKFRILSIEDPDFKERYLRRISVHKEYILKHKNRIEQIEMILLDS